MLDLLILSVLIGFALGLISGLIPGIHTNNFALEHCEWHVLCKNRTCIQRQYNLSQMNTRSPQISTNVLNRVFDTMVQPLSYCWILFILQNILR